MTLTTPIKSGNVPLIMLACDSKDDANPLLRYPYAYTMVNSGTRPIIRTTELKSEQAARRLVLWLPVPGGTTPEQPKRCLSVCWRYNALTKGQGGTYAHPEFTVNLRSQPRRPDGSDGRFTEPLGAYAQHSAYEKAIHPLGEAKSGELTVTTFAVGGLDPEAGGFQGHQEVAECYLIVALPYVTGGTMNSLIFDIYGLAVDQW